MHTNAIKRVISAVFFTMITYMSERNIYALTSPKRVILPFFCDDNLHE